MLLKNQYNFYIIIKYTKIQYHIPIITLKSLLITLLYIQLTYIIAYSTKYELIILSFHTFLKKIDLYKYKKNFYFILTLLFTSKFLEKIINNAYKLNSYIKIKYYFFILSNNFFYIIKKLIYKYLNLINHDTYILTYNLWNKKIINDITK